MSTMRDLLGGLNAPSLSVAGQIAVSFFENPFLEAHFDQMDMRFQCNNLSEILDEMCAIGILAKESGCYRLSVTEDQYGALVDWVRALRGQDEVLREEVVAFETLARLREKLAVSQEEVSFILDMVPVGVILLDHLGQVLKANVLAEKLTVGWQGLQVHLGVDLDALRKQPFETELDGTPPVAVTTRPFQVAGSDTGVVVVIQDITGKREMAAQAEKLREDFFSMIRHELRKPLLTVERSLAQLGTAEGTSPLALARSATDHLGSMIDDMLFLARLERDPFAVEQKPDVSLRFLLAGCDLAFRQQAADAEVTFTVAFPNDDVSFCADEGRLQQVLGNLLDNALKFTPQGGQVHLSGFQEGNLIVLRVADSGPGIPPEERDQIFGKFYQVQSDASRKPGLGLGLAISHQVILAHGGSIEVGVSEWGGAAMYVKVPIKRSDVQ